MNSIDLGQNIRICDVIALTLQCHQDPFGANLAFSYLSNLYLLTLGRILASHPAAPGSILGATINCSLDVVEIHFFDVFGFS